MSDTSSKQDLLNNLAHEFAERCRRGERPSLTEYTARHPELAAEIRDVFPAVLVMEEFGSVAGQPGTPPSPPLGGCLGDFRLVREVGRGGMGIVYEAEQLSLDRRVALKVLPFAAAVDARQLQRFKIEVQAAACLHHQHIVPVYAVGCERGVHFYAMQFIDGRSLAVLIQELRHLAGLETAAGEKPTGPAREPAPRSAPLPEPAGPSPADPQPTGPYTPAPGKAHGREAPATSAGVLSTTPAARDPAFCRTVARLGIQAAEALEHAHQLGVVHRDIKPGNLMLDGHGDLWITDFGLAQVQSDTRLTLTGDLVGTLRYMSPEQALGQRAVIDHRADVYSLGVTLYELLTLEPAFTGSDRQELLRQIAFEEPRPPRRLNKALPRELETVVLKAMAKVPGERYARAQELADDLGRFLKDEPIRAKRPWLWQRARKWSRRHPSLVWATVVCLVVAGAVSAGSLGWALRDRAARQVEAADAISATLKDAKALRARGHWAAAWAKIHQVEALLPSAGGNGALKEQWRAVKADLEMVERLEDARLRYTAVNDEHFDHEGARRAVARAFQQYKLPVLDLDPAEAATRIIASAIEEPLLAGLYFWAGLTGKGTPEGRKIMVVVRLADRDEWRRQVYEALVSKDLARLRQLAVQPEILAQPASTVVTLGLTLARKDRPAAVELLRRGQQAHPDDFWINQVLATELRNLKPARLSEAIGFHRAALAAHPDSPGAHLNLGNALVHHGQTEEGMVAYRRAIALKPDYAAARSNLGFELRKKGLLDEAIASCREATRLKPKFAQAHGNLGSALGDKGLWDEAVVEFKKAIRLKPNFVEARNGLGILLSYEKGDHAAAVRVFRETIAVTAKLVRENPDNGWYRHHRAGAHYHLGRLLDSKTQAKDKEQAFRAASAIWQQLARDFPEVAEYPSGQAVALHDLAPLVGRRGDAVQDRDLMRQAVQLQQAALALHPKNPEYRKRLVEHLPSLAHALIVLKEHAPAVAAAEELVKVAPESWKSYYEAAQVYTACANLAAQDRRLPPTKRNELLRAHAQRHNVLFREAAERKPDQAEAQTNLAWFLVMCPNRKFRNPSLAVELAEKAVKPGPPQAISWAVLGAAYYRAGQGQKALAALEKSLQLQGNNDGPALFFLAMTQWQRGEKQRARQRYEQGVQELAKRPNDGHLRGLRDEAAKLLGPPKQ